MKKMSEVFELPLTGASLEFHLQNTEFCTEQDHAAHAINHVDALALALTELVQQVEDFYADSNEPLIHLERAIAALASYRGEK